MEKSMTTGNPFRLILNFTIPVYIGYLFQQIYNMVDTIIVGRFVGTSALAGVGSTGTINFMILGFMMGLCAGVTVLVSQRFGAKDEAATRRSAASAIVICVSISIVMTILSMLFMKPLLHFMNTPEDIYADAYTYIMIICSGILALTLYNLFSCILRALGNSKVPLFFLILSALLNIILDLTFILVFHMGVAGAAWATVISQGVSAVLCLIYILKKVPILKFSKEDFRPNFHLIRLQLSVGFPMAFQYSITAIGTTMVQATLNRFGALHVAAFTTSVKVEQIFGQMYVALGSAIATYAAQNEGAGLQDRIRKGFAATTLISFVFSAVAGTICFYFGYRITPLFVSENVNEISSLVDIYMKCSSLFFIPLAIVNIYRNGLQGMGFGLMPMMAGVAELAGRGVVAVIAAKLMSYPGVCLASPVAWVLASAFLLIVYSRIMKKRQHTGQLC